jgi:hypothetical protein
MQGKKLSYFVFGNSFFAYQQSFGPKAQNPEIPYVKSSHPHLNAK